MNPPKKSHDARVNLAISLVFHGSLIVAITYFAAREGILGKKLQEISVTLAPKEKKPDPPKEKPPEPPPEPPRLAQKTPPPANLPPPVAPVVTAPPAGVPPPASAPSAAPAATALPAFEFNDGARAVETISDPTAIYKALVERALRARWNRPEDLEDDAFVAEVELAIDKKGNIEDVRWLRGSGNRRWDDSVRSSLASVRSISRPPPPGFPSRFVTRFDVEVLEAEPSGLQ